MNTSAFTRRVAILLVLLLLLLSGAALAATAVTPATPATLAKPPLSGPAQNPFVPKDDGKITDVKVTPENVWYTGTTVKIQWSWPGYVGFAAEVALYRGDTKVVTIDPGQTKLYTQWVVPHDFAGGNYTVVVRSVRNPVNSASAPVGITDSTLAVASPRPGDKWAIGSKYQVVWSYKGNPGPVKLELTKPDGGVSMLIADNLTGTSGAGTYDWTISDFVRPSSAYQLRVTSMANSRITAVGPAFGIETPFLALYEPRVSTSVAAGTKVPIKWNWVGDLGPTVNITVTPQNSASPVLDVDNYAIGSGGFGEYLQWTPPSLPNTQQYTIKLQSVQRSTFISQRTITVFGTAPPASGANSPQAAAPGPASPALVRAQATFSTYGDGKDLNTAVYLSTSRTNGLKVAWAEGAATNLYSINGNSFTVELQFDKTVVKSDCKDLILKVGEKPSGNDLWQFHVKVVLFFADGSQVWRTTDKVYTLAGTNSQYTEVTAGGLTAEH